MSKGISKNLSPTPVEYSEEDFQREVEENKQKELWRAEYPGREEELARLKTESNDYWVISVFNNFHSHLPGGIYRRMGIHKETQGSIDRLIEELGIDLQELLRQRLRSTELSRRFNQLAQEEGTDRIEKLKEVAAQSEKLCYEQQSTFVKLYVAMRRLGYSRQDLVG